MEAASSLGVLALVANMQRTNNMTMVQEARPLDRGSLPLLARMLTHNQAPFKTSPPKDEKLMFTFRQASVPATKAVVEEPALVKAPAKPIPQKYLKDLFAELNIGDTHIPKRYSKDDFVKPEDDEIRDYNEAANFVRTNNLDEVRRLYEDGKNLDCCNRVGESLLHLACRRGHVQMAEFLLNEAKVRWDRQDDFGKTILHDALWRPSPSIELMEVIMKVVSPEWLMALDIRGHSPFDYARREHLPVWYDFLKEREDLLRRRLALLA